MAAVVMGARKLLAILPQDGFKVYPKMVCEFTPRWTSLPQDTLPILIAPPAWILNPKLKNQNPKSLIQIRNIYKPYLTPQP